MIEFLFGTLIQILIIQTDINDYFGVKKWDLRFWKYSLINGFISYVFFMKMYEMSAETLSIVYIYISVLIFMFMVRKNENWIATKDIIRFKVILNYAYIVLFCGLFMITYQFIFDNFVAIYERTLLFYMLAFPAYASIVVFRKAVKKNVENKNKSKNGDCDGNDRHYRNSNHANGNESNVRWLAQRFTQFQSRPVNIMYLNLAGYGALLFVSNATGTLRFYIGFMISISLIRCIAKPFLIRSGYFIKHCDAWKDCFSSTHFLYFIALYFCIQSNYDISVLLTMAAIANFETVRRQDNV